VASFSARVPQSKYDHAPTDVLRSLPFWLMYAIFVMVGTGGLMANRATRSGRWGLCNRARPDSRADDAGAQFCLVDWPRA
jgi:hypothetical protein